MTSQTKLIGQHQVCVLTLCFGLEKKNPQRGPVGDGPHCSPTVRPLPTSLLPSTQGSPLYLTRQRWEGQEEVLKVLGSQGSVQAPTDIRRTLQNIHAQPLSLTPRDQKHSTHLDCEGQGMATGGESRGYSALNQTGEISQLKSKCIQFSEHQHLSTLEIMFSL